MRRIHRRHGPAHKCSVCKHLCSMIHRSGKCLHSTLCTRLLYEAKERMRNSLYHSVQNGSRGASTLIQNYCKDRCNLLLKDCKGICAVLRCHRFKGGSCHSATTFLCVCFCNSCIESLVCINAVACKASARSFVTSFPSAVRTGDTDFCARR